MRVKLVVEEIYSETPGVTVTVREAGKENE